MSITQKLYCVLVYSTLSACAGYTSDTRREYILSRCEAARQEIASVRADIASARADVAHTRMELKGLENKCRNDPELFDICEKLSIK